MEYHMFKRLLLAVLLLVSFSAFAGQLESANWVDVGRFTWPNYSAEVYYLPSIIVAYPNNDRATTAKQIVSDGTIHYFEIEVGCTSNLWVASTLSENAQGNIINDKDFSDPQPIKSNSVASTIRDLICNATPTFTVLPKRKFIAT